MASKKHIHKYQQQKLGSYNVWGCAFPECSHYMPINQQDRIMGRMSVCWNECGNTVIMTPEIISNAIENNSGRIYCKKCEEAFEYAQAYEKILKGEL
jgi:hypothetical protein